MIATTPATRVVASSGREIWVRNTAKRSELATAESRRRRPQAKTGGAMTASHSVSVSLGESRSGCLPLVFELLPARTPPIVVVAHVPSNAYFVMAIVAIHETTQRPSNEKPPKPSHS